MVVGPRFWWCTSVGRSRARVGVASVAQKCHKRGQGRWAECAGAGEVVGGREGRGGEDDFKRASEFG